jgi:hypothetical protein
MKVDSWVRPINVAVVQVYASSIMTVNAGAARFGMVKKW